VLENPALDSLAWCFCAVVFSPLLAEDFFYLGTFFKVCIAFILSWGFYLYLFTHYSLFLQKILKQSYQSKYLHTILFFPLFGLSSVFSSLVLFHSLRPILIQFSASPVPKTFIISKLSHKGNCLNLRTKLFNVIEPFLCHIVDSFAQQFMENPNWPVAVAAN